MCKFWSLNVANRLLKHRCHIRDIRLARSIMHSWFRKIRPRVWIEASRKEQKEVARRSSYINKDTIFFSRCMQDRHGPLTSIRLRTDRRFMQSPRYIRRKEENKFNGRVTRSAARSIRFCSSQLPANRFAESGMKKILEGAYNACVHKKRRCLKLTSTGTVTFRVWFLSIAYSTDV